MSTQSLEDAVQEIGDPIEARLSAPGMTFPGIKLRGTSFTNWVDEQRAWEETCYVGDYSFTEEIRIEGPDALDFFRDVSVNSFETVTTDLAKFVVQCNTNGQSVGNGLLYRVDEETFDFQALPVVTNPWLKYQLEIGDYDAIVKDRETFMIGVQGPNALKVVEKMIDGKLANYRRRGLEQVEVDGVSARTIGHGMAGASGVEFQGPMEHAEHIWNVAVEAGREYGIRQLGGRAQFTARTVGSSIPVVGVDYLPAIYGEDTREFREWLPAKSPEAMLSIEGSFDGDHISDWFRSPVELNRGNLISFDHEFIGREALEAEIENPQRTYVNLVWNDEDVREVLASYTEEDNYKFLDVPAIQKIRLVLDEVRKDGDLVGTCSHPSYSYTAREFVSPATLDVDHAEPGTEVTIVWGEGNEDDEIWGVMPHVQTEVRATVVPGQYKTDRRGE
ncbi:MAG: hypothetical protein V5A27_05280 [Halapricum sp.]